MAEIDLMARYPKSQRKDIISERVAVSEEDRRIARQFGREYFDGPRVLGLGGYHYNAKFFTPVVEDMIKHWGLTSQSKILDVGCGKGFMMHDFAQALPGVEVAGIDISDYCIENAMPDMKPFIKKASCDALPYPDHYFDVVIAIATIHNLEYDGVKKSLEEIVRVGKGPAFVKINGYRSDWERDQLNNWNLVAKTILPVEEWLKLFQETGYTGDYSFFTP